MKRREALKNTTLILGYAVSASAVTAVLSGCTNNEPMNTGVASEGVDTWVPAYFSNEEIDLIAEICDTILPETESPGAKAAFAHRYIDIMIKDHYQLRDQQAFKRGLTLVDEDCLHYYGRKFVRCTPDIRLNYLLDIEEKTKVKLDKGVELLGSRPFFAMIKELTWIGFFTSKLIGEEYLNYDPIPGGYHGCIPVDEADNRNWSL